MHHDRDNVIRSKVGYVQRTGKGELLSLLQPFIVPVWPGCKINGSIEYELSFPGPLYVAHFRTNDEIPVMVHN